MAQTETVDMSAGDKGGLSCQGSSTAVAEVGFENISILYYPLVLRLSSTCMCVCFQVHMNMPQHMWKGQRTACRNPFSPTVWVPGIELKPSGTAEGAFAHRDTFALLPWGLNQGLCLAWG